MSAQAPLEARRPPTQRMMEAFYTVMVAGSVSGAARALGISQPAVSRLLKQFEEELGFALFYRGKGKLTPTPEAHLLSVDVGHALDSIDRVSRSADDVRRYGVEYLRIGVTPMLYQAVLHRLLEHFLTDQPHLVLTMETGVTGTMVELLLRDQVEIAFASLLSGHPGIEAIPLIETESVVLLPRGHWLSDKESIDPEDLSEVPLIAMTRRYPSRHRIEQFFRSAGVSMNLHAETNFTSAICDLVRMGQGVAIMNALSWDGGDGTLEVRPLTSRLGNRYGILHVADRDLSRVALQLVAALRAHLAESMPEVYLGETSK